MDTTEAVTETMSPGSDSSNSSSSGVDEANRLRVETTAFTSLAIISLLIITTNTFTIIVIGTTSRLKNVTGHLMLSLAVADIGVGVMTAIPLVYAAFSEYLTPAACDVIGFLGSVSWVVSVFTLSLLSLDRLVSIVQPLRYHTLVTGRVCLMAILLTWLLACVIWMLPLIGIGSYKFNNEEVTCYFDVSKHPAQWIIYMAIIFIPSGIVLAISYSWIWCVAKKQKDFVGGTLNNEALNTSRKNFRAMRTLIIIVGAFYIAWLPFIIEHITKAAIGHLEAIPEWLEIMIYMIAVTNSFWNPVIYVTTNRTFRHANMMLMLRLCPCCACIKPRKVNDIESVDREMGDTNYHISEAA